MKLPALLLLLALAGSLAGCGEVAPKGAVTGAHDVAPATTPRPTPSAREADRFIARAAVLRLSDFPAGWRIEPDDDGEGAPLPHDRLDRAQPEG